MAKKEKKKKVESSISLSGRILVIAFCIAGLVFYATTILLVIGMLPTIVAKLVDKTKEKTKSMTIGFMNFAGCFLFWYEILEKGHNIDAVLAVLSNPTSIVIIYSTAMLGYLIEWGVVGFAANIAVQRGKTRLVTIKKQQEELVRKWGPEVTGERSSELIDGVSNK